MHLSDVLSHVYKNIPFLYFMTKHLIYSQFKKQNYEAFKQANKIKQILKKTNKQMVEQ